MIYFVVLIRFHNKYFTMSQGLVKIYVRNSLKYGKVLDIPSPTTANQLYKQAAASQRLKEDEIHLYLNGKIIPNNGQELTLKPQAIIHIINLNRVNLQTIQVNVRMISGRTSPIKIQVNNTETIRSFIDNKLYKVYGERSDKLLLVHIGRQLKMESTFAEEEIQDGSQLFCINVEEVKKKENKQVEPERQQLCNVAVKDLQVPEEPKDIYPARNFLIETPQQINAKSNMELLFDAKIHHTSSLPNYELAAEEVIPEQCNLASADSENKEQEKKETPQLKEESSSKLEGDNESSNLPQQVKNQNQERRQEEVERQVRQVEEEQAVQTQVVNPPQANESSNVVEAVESQEPVLAQTNNIEQQRQEQVEVSKEAVNQIYEKIATEESNKVEENTEKQQKENIEKELKTQNQVLQDTPIQTVVQETRQESQPIEKVQKVQANSRANEEEESLI